MTLLKKFCLPFISLVLLCIGCGGKTPLIINHIVERPSNFRMDSVKSITIGKVNDEGKRFDQNEVLRSLVIERFAGNSYYVIYDGMNEQNVGKNNVVLTITMLSNDCVIRNDTFITRVPTKNKDKNGRRGDSTVKTYTRNAYGEYSVSCRIVNSSNRAIVAVRTFTETVSKTLKADEELKSSLKKSMEKEAIVSLAIHIRNWLLPYSDNILLTLFEDDEVPTFKKMRELIEQNDYSSAIQLLKDDSKTLKNDDPNLPKMFYNLGCLQLYDNKYEDSRSSFEYAHLRGVGNKIYKEKLELIQTLIAEKKELQARKNTK